MGCQRGRLARAWRQFEVHGTAGGQDNQCAGDRDRPCRSDLQGPWKGMIYGGFSVAATAQGEVIAIGKDRQPDIKVISIDLNP